MSTFIVKHEPNKAARVAGIYNGVLPEGEHYFVGFSVEDIPNKDMAFLKAEFAEPDYIVTYDDMKKKARDRMAIGEPKVMTCHRILKYINGFNSEKLITAAEAQTTANTFSVIMLQLLSGGLGTSKLLIEAADLTGTFYSESDRAEILAFIDWEIEKLTV